MIWDTRENVCTSMDAEGDHRLLIWLACCWRLLPVLSAKHWLDLTEMFALEHNLCMILSLRLALGQFWYFVTSFL